MFNVKDMVRTPYGEVAEITEIGVYGEGRDGRVYSLPIYHVPSNKPGSPVEWWTGDQLTAINNNARSALVETIRAHLLFLQRTEPLSDEALALRTGEINWLADLAHDGLQVQLFKRALLAKLELETRGGEVRVAEILKIASEFWGILK